jgi:hypothetical protein
MLNTASFPEVSTYFIIKVKYTGNELILGPYIYLSEASSILLDHLEVLMKLYKVSGAFVAELSEYYIDNNDYVLIKTILQEEGNTNA